MHAEYFEVNISRNGKHFFATDERSLTSVPELETVLPVLFTKFPESEGYLITVTRWTMSGRVMYLPVMRARALAGGVK